MGKVSSKKEIKRVYKKSDDNFFNVNKIIFENGNMLISVDKKNYIVELKKISKKLSNATKIQKEAYRIICSGYGINWPLIDEDITIKGILSKAKEIIQ